MERIKKKPRTSLTGIEEINYQLNINVNNKKSICIYSHKGGVGKTTFTINFVNDLFIKNPKLKICMVDMDPQMNITYFLMNKHYNEELFNKQLKEYRHTSYSKNKNINTRFDILSKLFTFYYNYDYVGEQNLNIQKNEEYGCVDLIVGNYKMNEILNKITTEYYYNEDGNAIKAVAKLFEKLKKHYDVVVLDLSPDMYTLNKCILYYSDYVVSILTPDCFAKVSLKMLKENFYMNDDKFQLFNNPKTKFLGFVLNRVTITGGSLIKAENEFKNKLIEFCDKQFNKNCYLGFIEDFSGNTNIQLHKNMKYLSENIIGINKDKKEQILKEFTNILNNIIKNMN